ncbi:MAG: efflux RND transporter periplasmic adaptor subunit [bacterium]
MKKIMVNGIMILLFFSMLLVLTTAGCNKEELTIGDKEERSEGTGIKHEGEDHKNEITLTEEQIAIMGIEFSKMESQNINGYIKVNGEIMMNQDNESKVGSIIPGRVKKIFVNEGSFVRAGQTLATIENPDLINVQVDYINAKNEFEFAKQEYNRQQKLSSDNIGSKKNLAEIESSYKRALANYKTLEEKLAAYKISTTRFDNIYQDTVANLQRNYSITSPISGNVVSRKITIGQYVEPSMDMFYIVNTSSVYVDLSIFEKDLHYVSIGQKVDIATGSNPDQVYQGKVSFINKVFDDKNRTVKVRIIINNKSRELYPFMFVTAKIYINDGNVLAVPISAIESEGESKYIFVKTNERKKIEAHAEHSGEEEHKEGEEHSGEEGIVFKKVQVNTGISDDNFIEIFPIEEINNEGEVVSKGTFFLKSELMKEELGEHEH